jgi:hypothetical protein
MRKIHRGKIPIIVFLTTLVLLLVFCSDQEFAIFYYIENEREQKDESLENELSITSMLKVGNYYFIAAGGDMFRREETDNDWDSIEFPSGADYCTAMALFNGKLYAGFLEGNETFRFYSGTPSLKPDWQRITDSKIDGKQVIRAEVITGLGPTEQLFVFTFKDDKYSLYWSNNGSTYSDGILDQEEMLRNVTYNSTGGSEQYWAVSDAKIFTHTGSPVAGTFTEKTSNIPDDNGGYRGVYFSATHDKYYISTAEGVVASSTDGDTWVESDTQSVSGKDVPLGFIGEVANASPPWPPDPTESNVLVAAVGYGFYEMPDGDVTSLDRMSEFIATELYLGWVTGFFVDYDTPTPLVFVYTAGSGLWRNEYGFPGGWGGDWIWE